MVIEKYPETDEDALRWLSVERAYVRFLKDKVIVSTDWGSKIDGKAWFTTEGKTLLEAVQKQYDYNNAEILHRLPLDIRDNKLEVAKDHLINLSESKCYNCLGENTECMAQEHAKVALRELDETKWDYKKLEDAIIKLDVKDANDPRLTVLFREAGWFDEEFHWESVRHYNNLCGCWNKFPENRNSNPSPL